MRILVANSYRLLLQSLEATELLGVDDNPPPTPNKTVLLVGNSHLRQVSESLMCQHWAQAEDAIQIGDRNTFTVHFHNNATIHVLINSPFVYSHKWVDLLESRLIKQPIASLDAIVLGKFHSWNDSQYTAFHQEMQDLSTNKTIEGMDFNTIKPPEIGSVAEVYNGPIVAVSMFSKYAESEGINTERTMNILAEGSKGRKNLRCILGRKYIDELGLECGTDTGTGGTCNEPVASSSTATNDSTATSDPRNWHRCTGAHGGHSDLLSFDIVEELFALLE